MPPLSKKISVCVLEDDPAALRSTRQILRSSGYKVSPFTTLDAILQYARVHRPHAAIVGFGRSASSSLEVAAQLRKISPLTSVIISLKVHQARARTLLSGRELVQLIEQQCVHSAVSRPAISKGTEGEF